MDKPSHEIDALDAAILEELQKDVRVSFQDLARKLNVAGGTIHFRYNRLREAGLLKGVRLLVDTALLGYQIEAFIGINLHNAGDHKLVVERLRQMPEVTEAYYTTGPYSLFIKILVKNTKDLHLFLVEKLQPLAEIQSTETLIALDVPIDRTCDFKRLVPKE